MSQKLIQTQEQKTVQVQRLTQQQMLAVRLLEMPLAELEQSIQAEIDDNPALETSAEDPDAQDLSEPADDADPTGGEADDYAEQTEREERESALDDALSNIGMDDRMPDAVDRTAYAQTDNAEYEEMVYGERLSFYDSLKEQMVDVELTDEERDIMEYVIGSLDNDGLLRKDADTLCDELAIYHNIYTTAEQVKALIGTLQTFEPAGIAAATLQECLLLQIQRRKPSAVTTLMRRVVETHFDDFMNKRWSKVVRALSMSEGEADAVRTELLRLNPKPGASLGETEGRNMQQITPDFIIDTDDGGNVSFSLNTGKIPVLHVSPSFTGLIKAYRENKASMSRRDKEALLYTKEKVERAQGYIDAVKQRQHTLYITMKAIIDIQRRFFQDGDEADIRPMILKDVAERTGLDISTVSRVSNQKYAQTRWGVFRLRHFFSDAITTDQGEALSTRKIKTALKEVIAAEDKTAPLSDDAIKTMLSKKGYPIARRTIAKYREQLGIPVARLRRK